MTGISHDLSLELVEAVIALCNAFELGYCDERCEHGGVCSLLEGHLGPHQSEGFSEILCTWGEAQ